MQNECEFRDFGGHQTENTTISRTKTELNTYADLNLTAGLKEDL